jgi:hypothetical protein
MFNEQVCIAVHFAEHWPSMHKFKPEGQLFCKGAITTFSLGHNSIEVTQMFCSGHFIGVSCEQPFSLGKNLIEIFSRQSISESWQEPSGQMTWFGSTHVAKDGHSS